VKRAVNGAFSYLVARAGDDNGWHSDTYGQLRGGAATTALIVYAIASLPEELRPRQAKERSQCAIEFLSKGIDNAGCVANPDGSLDYPGYASAMLLVAVDRLQLQLDAERREKLIDYLLRIQSAESRGFSPGNTHYGGWDLLGDAQLPGMTAGTNVSMSAFALEALALDNGPRSQQARDRARGWAARCQNLPGDGGFRFHPDPHHDGNKALWSDAERKQARSYGTATCDGLRCLLTAGENADDANVRAAADWLAARPRVDVVPGFEETPPESDWRRGLHVYYLAALAKTLHLLPADEAARRREAILRVLLARQKEDGRWENESAQMREDDPLIATGMALVAIGHLTAR
jgi:hypothetical protein